MSGLGRTGTLGVAVIAVALVSAEQVSGVQASGADLDARVRGADAEEVAFRYETHDDVRRCGNGWSRGGNWDRADCWSGPAEVVLELRSGEVVDLDVEIVRAGEDSPRGVQNLGEVEPEVAANYLLSLVERTRPSVAEDAIGAAVMADEVVLWPELLEFARDRSLDGDVRTSATFWVGQASADEAVVGLREIADDDPDTDVREAAVFAISQRDEEQAVPILMEIAQDSDNADVRRSAFFWLAQHDDPRVLDFFERVLKGSG